MIAQARIRLQVVTYLRAQLDDGLTLLRTQPNITRFWPEVIRVEQLELLGLELGVLDCPWVSNDKVSVLLYF